ncbi:hypothetical protein [Patulibacter sp. SYSU D01012]|uniref:hypothetical protein n=1 Tax=Patulibacter sp. SYSU D01012 TaxID=2817381 RepID=UPI001B3162A4|nr:hypothetical protein [Patulibacter sp. SYSU D01012]
MRTTTGLRLGAAAVGALGALAVLPGGANAAFDAAHAAQCQNAASLNGAGASFQNTAQNAWGASIVGGAAAPQAGFGYASLANGGCTAFRIGGTRTITYTGSGSGAGRRAFGASTTAGQAGVRDTTIHYGGADEAPSAQELAAANNGPDGQAGTADDASLLTIPVAQSAIAIAVKLPDGCTAPTGRTITKALLERAFGGDVTADQWGEILPSISSDCAAKPVTRVVRNDSSGTTFQLKQFLQVVNPGRQPTAWKDTANQAWPNDGGATAVVRGQANGAGSQLDALSARTDGGIAYADLATARGKGYGATDATRFWLDVQVDGSNFQSPALQGAPGANCRNVTYKDPSTNALPASAKASWFNVTGAGTATDYPLCALTYGLAWEDMAKANVGRANGKPDYTQDQARAVKDYLAYVTNANGGQAALEAAGYQGLPTVDPASTTGAGQAGTVLALAQAGVKALTWNAATVTDPGENPGGGDTGGGGNGGGTTGGGTPKPPVQTPPVQTPPVQTPPAKTPAPTKATLKVSRAAVAKGRAFTLTLAPSTAGRVSVVATVKSGAKTVTVATGSGAVKPGSAAKVAVKATKAGKRALKAGRAAKVTFRITFTAADGAKVTTTKTFKVKVK